MLITELRVQNFRAFADTGLLRLGPCTAIVGRNDAGKSAILHALRIFFEPPKRGGLDVNDIHAKDSSKEAVVEVAFDPERLQTQHVQVDAKNKVHLRDDCLVDGKGLLRVRVSLSTKTVEAFDILIEDVDDDSMFPLCLKGHEELLRLLEANGLPAVRAGKETNADKRDTLRRAVRERGVGTREEWVDACAAEKPLRDILPTFSLFTDSARYAIGETAVQNQFRGVVNRALGTHGDAQEIEVAIQSTVQAEFDKLYERLARLTDTVTGLRADTRVSWKKAVEGIDLRWTDAAGIDLPYDLRGAGVRRLFMVAYFQYEAAASIHDSNGPRYVFAIEEPEVHLHPGAQRDLDNALRELGHAGHTVLFTTHSPVFASTTSLDDLVLVRRSGAAAIAEQLPDLDVVNVARELGVEASDRLVGKNHVILVEGRHDAEFYQVVLRELFSNGSTKLDPDAVPFLQCGGISNLRFVVTAQCIEEAGLKWSVLVDSDRQTPGGPLGKDTQRLLSACPSSCACLRHLERTAIENYLDPVAVKSITGIDCRIPTHGKPSDPAGRFLRSTQYKAIKRNAAAIAKAMGAPGLIAASTDSGGKCELVGIFEDIRCSFGL